MKNKIVSLRQAAKFAKIAKSKGNKVGLVVGSFDILHLGHVNLFRLAKKHVDYLIVGLDNDRTIKQVKGINRPINNYSRRSNLLSDLVSVDLIFEIKRVSDHSSEQGLEVYKELVSKILPTHIFTHPICDRHWKNKKNLANEMGIIFLKDKSNKITNSGTIINKLTSEW